MQVAIESAPGSGVIVSQCAGKFQPTDRDKALLVDDGNPAVTGLYQMAPSPSFDVTSARVNLSEIRMGFKDVNWAESGYQVFLEELVTWSPETWEPVEYFIHSQGVARHDN
ncbi:MAG TPA: hypothetical protein VGR43_10690 [Dehalococcoidia bacterium]|nr:hypothetical protein [Dehalococcoidia bacterium]